MISHHASGGGRSWPSLGGSGVWRRWRSRGDWQGADLALQAALLGAGGRSRLPIAMPGVVLLLFLAGCWHDARYDLPSKFDIVGSGAIGQGMDVSLILDRKKLSSPGEIPPGRAMILISIDTSSYKGREPALAIFDIAYAREVADGGRFGTSAHVDKKNLTHATITGPDWHGKTVAPVTNYLSCTPTPMQITISQGPGLLRDYVL